MLTDYMEHFFFSNECYHLNYLASSYEKYPDYFCYVLLPQIQTGYASYAVSTNNRKVFSNETNNLRSNIGNVTINIDDTKH